jgi:cobalamin synthase
VLATVVSAALLGWPGLIVVASGLALAMLASVYLRCCLGGLTGDVYGAINEAVEVVALLAGALLAPLG